MTIVTLSMEVELAWGHHDLDQDPTSPGREVETAFLDRLLARCDDADVPFSFDVVGHLLRESCDGCGEDVYPDGWFDADPGTSVEENPEFYAPDLVDAMEAADVDHEICTHSYSHADCDLLEADAVRRDLERAQELHERRFGERTVSFVPPRHHTPPTSALHDTGIEIIRMHDESPLPSPPRRFLGHLIGTHEGMPLELHDGVVYTRCSKRASLLSSLLPQGQEPTHPVLRYLPMSKSTRRRHHLRTLVESVEGAIDSGEPLHLWCHLYDMANEQQWTAIGAFLGWLGEQRDAGRIELLTMAELNRRARNGELPIQLREGAERTPADRREARQSSGAGLDADATDRHASTSR